MTAPGFVLEVGGLRLVAAPFEQLGVEQDGWITAKLERVGLADPRLRTLVTAEDRAREVRLRILESGQIAGLLAGFLVAQGAGWSAESARAHEQQLGAATTVLERQLMHAMVEGLVQGFFARGSLSDGATGKPSPAATGEASSPESSAASAAATGNPSSAPLPATTLTPSAASSPGPSATPLAPTSST